MKKHIEDSFGTFYEPPKRDSGAPFYGRVVSDLACLVLNGHSKNGKRIWKLVRYLGPSVSGPAGKQPLGIFIEDVDRRGRRSFCGWMGEAPVKLISAGRSREGKIIWKLVLRKAGPTGMRRKFSNIDPERTAKQRAADRCAAPRPWVRALV